MLQRCYETTYHYYKWYGAKGVTVCKDWHNFQNFAQWYDDNYIEGYDLDKDLLGGTEYNPDNCQFVSPSVNRGFKRASTYKSKKL